MTKHRNPCRSHPRRVMVYELTLSKFVCAGCLHNDEPEDESIVAKELASRKTSTPMLIEAIEEEHRLRRETLSRGMYFFLLGQNTDAIALELERLRTEREAAQ